MRRAKLVCGLLLACLACAGTTVNAQTTLPAVIPIFPLEPPMLFPGVSRPLYIFEDRYRAMVTDALKGDSIIGMVTLKPGYEANYRGRPPIYEIGCAGVITEFEELPGGRFSIVLQGVVKFRVNKEDDSQPYRLAHVTAMPEVVSDQQTAAVRKGRQHLEALITKGGASKVPPETTDEQLINMVAQYLPMDSAKRQELLELENVLLRVDALIELIEARAGVRVSR